MNFFTFLRWIPIYDRLTLGRLFSGGLALVLALLYSGLLGVEKRSVLSFSLSTSLLLTLVAVSPFLTRYKKTVLGKPLSDSHHGSYFLLCCLLSLSVGVIFLFFALLYSRIVTTLPTNLLIVMFFYSIVSTLSFGLQDILPIVGAINMSIFSEIALVLCQLILFFFLINLEEVSIIVSVFLSFIFTYTIHISCIASIIFFHQPKPALKQSLGNLIQIRELFLTSSAIHIADRIDKVVIAFFLPIATLAQFTTMAAFFAPLRIITEGATRQLYFTNQNILSNSNKLEKRVRNKSVNYSLWLIFLLVILFLAAQSVNFLIGLILGDDWLLPLYIVVLYLLYELIRGFFLYVSNYRIRLDHYRNARRAPILLMIFAVILVPLGVNYFGLEGGVIAMIASFIFILVGFKLTHAI